MTSCSAALSSVSAMGKRKVTFKGSSAPAKRPRLSSEDELSDDGDDLMARAMEMQDLDEEPDSDSADDTLHDNAEDVEELSGNDFQSDQDEGEWETVPVASKTKLDPIQATELLQKPEKPSIKALVSLQLCL